MNCLAVLNLNAYPIDSGGHAYGALSFQLPYIVALENQYLTVAAYDATTPPENPEPSGIGFMGFGPYTRNNHMGFASTFQYTARAYPYLYWSLTPPSDTSGYDTVDLNSPKYVLVNKASRKPFDSGSFSTGFSNSFVIIMTGSYYTST